MATIAITLPSTLTLLGGPLPSVGAQTAPPVILADLYDPSTRDFRSMLSTFDHIDAQVVIALTTYRGSGAAVEDTGHRLYDIKKIRESIETEIAAEVKTALKRLTTNKDITLLPTTFETDVGNQQVDFVVSWKNNRAGTLASVRLLMGTR